jgi:hypothetical protein
MKSTVFFGLILSAFALGCPAALAAQDDVQFLCGLGGKAMLIDGRTAVKFDDGTVVVFDGAAISTKDVVGDVFITDATNQYVAVDTAASGLVEYQKPVELAGLVTAK